MGDFIVRKVGVSAELDHLADAVGRAREEAADGDDSWQEWLDELERGEALVLAMTTSIEYEHDGEIATVEIDDRPVWVHNDLHPPVIGEQLRELASKDFAPLAERLAGRGIDVDDELFDRMLVEVSIGEEVLRKLAPRESAADFEASFGPAAEPPGPAVGD